MIIPDQRQQPVTADRGHTDQCIWVNRGYFTWSVSAIPFEQQQ